jgi:uncharacterized protein YabE (DUF348 family)
MAQPAHLVVVPARTAPRWGEFVLPPTTQIETPERTHISRSALPNAGRWVLRVLVLALAIAGPLLAFGGEHKVSIDLEGVVKTVRTYAADATSLLERRGLHAGNDDMLTSSSGLGDGSRVTYRRAKRVKLVLDGKRQTVTARGLTVGQALNDLGLRPGPKDHVFPSPATKLRPGTEIFVRNAIHAKLRVDGRLRDVVSSADTVDNLLTQAGVSVGPHDYVLPARSTEPADGMWIRVVRVRHITDERNVRIPYRVVTRADPDMESGVRRVVQQGAEGLKVQRFAVVLEDGTRVSSRLLEEDVLRSARDHIVRVGTKEPQYTGGGGTQTGLASWFEADGLVAAHRSLPIGTVVNVTDTDTGKSVAVRINQRGPWVDGRIIDLSDDAFRRLAPLGEGTIRVTVHS